MAQLQDDRTDAQTKTHYWGIAGTDRYLSGWGRAQGGSSVAVWACKPDDADRVRAWVESRSDMLRVRDVDLRTYRPKAAHTHIYVVEDGRPALS